MANLNLLPPEEKIRLGYLFAARGLIAVTAALASAIAVFAILLLPTIFSLAFETQEVVRARHLEAASQERLGLAGAHETVREANQLARRVTRFEAERKRVPMMIEDIIEGTPPGVAFDLITYRAASGEIAIEGFSPTRADLLAFERALKQRPAVAAVASPVTNLVREANIRFSFVAKLR